MTTRAERRSHRARLKRARKWWWGRILAAKELGKVVDTPTPCSCWVCGNPRRYFGEEHISKLRADARERVELQLLPK